ncbi:MAG: hypothetical protein NXI31_27280 [bacterium]|nr:hypothetical protein [bacterium]
MPQFAAPIAPFAVEVWLTAGGQADKAEDPTVWQRIGTATGNANTEFATFLAPVHVPYGVYGVALHSSTLGPTATGTAAPVVVQNADLTLTLGRLRSTAPDQPFGPGAVRPMRPWTGTIYYERSQITDRAGHGFLGEGCAGTWPRATLRLARPPALGGTAHVDLDRLPDDAVLMMVGFDNRNSALGPLPLDLAPFGLDGCELRVRPDAAIALVGSSGHATWRLPIPNDPSLLHVRMFQQGVVFDSAHNPAGAVLSDAAGLVVGR